MAFCHPADGLNVAQAPGARFDVRFEVVGGIEVAMVPLGLFLDLRFEEVLRGPQAVGRQRSAPASSRASNKVVATLISARLSRWQSSMERTLCPTSRPISQRKVRNFSISGCQSAESLFGSSTMTSISELGCSSPRP